MSNFITRDDYLPSITDNRLTQITEANTALLDQVELTAISIVRDYLHTYYDVDTIFSQTAGNRAPQVVRWCVTLCVYFIYERIADRNTPERVTNNYEFTLETLESIADGKLSVELPPIADEEEADTKFRYGSLPPREHNIN